MRNSSLLYSHQRPAYPDNPAYSPPSTDVRPNTNGMAMGRTASAPAAAVIMREKQHQTGKYRQQRDDVPANSGGERLSGRRNNNKNGNYSSSTTNSGNESSSPGMANAQPAHHHSGSAHRRSASLLGRLRHSASASPTGSPTSSEGSSRDTSRSDRTLAHSASSGSMRQRKQTSLQRTHLAYTDTHAADDAKMVSRIPSAGKLGHGRPPQQSRPSVRVLPPQADAVRSPEHPDNRTALSSSSSSPATKQGKKRNSLRNGDPRSASGFISQLLRGSSRSTKSSPHVASLSPADSSSSRKFAVNSPGTPHGPHGSSPQAFDSMAAAEYSQPPAAVVVSPSHHQHHYAGFSPPNVCTVEYPPICMAADAAVYTTADMHGIQCADHGPQQPGVFCMQGGNTECMDSAGADPPSHGGVTMAPSSADMANGHPVSMADFYYMQQGNIMLGQPPAISMAEAGDAYSQPENWYETSGPANNGDDGGMADTAQLAGRLVSSLPVYEPIDLSRVHRTQHNGYSRATRPLLPDARILAPMTSLAEVYSSGTADYNMLSTRELRFAVENHMLVEQHKYLIRDLGHARSAIGALKQVVQDKEDRLEQFEMANVELQQKLVLVESLLTQEQRKRIESVRYSLGPASSALSTAQVDVDDGASGRQAQGADYDSMLSPQQDNSDESSARSADAGGLAVKLPTPSAQNMVQAGAPLQRVSGPSSPVGKQGDQESSSKRNNRPLSGYTTRYALNPKPVHQLPRVFSGDYSASEVQAMEHSVEALASAIASMPADDTSVEEIIASKMAEDDQHIRDQIRADSASAGEGGTQHVDTHGRRNAKDEHAESPQEPKRRSRFLSMLRLSTFGGSSPAARDQQQQQQQDVTELKHKRRSVSLGTRNPNQTHGEAANANQRSTSMALYEANGHEVRSRANSGESLAASCPTLLPGIVKSKQLHSKDQHGLQKQPSSAGSRFYPAGLGLSTEEEMDSSAGTSRQSSTKASSTMGGRTRDNSYQGAVSANKRDTRRLSHRMSLTGQPRRSTSAPSRPHSMRVSRRKSWLFQLFSSSSSVDSTTSSENNDGDDMSDHGSVDDEGLGKRVSRRRRVLTQSSEEITQFLGRLRLDDGSGGGGGGSGAHVGVGGVLEDVIDVSGEDEELANRASMSVAEVRQQTLDALNGTVRGSHQQPSLPILDTQINAYGKEGGAADIASPRSALSGPSEHGSPMSAASSVSSRRKGNPVKYDPDTNESADPSISRWRQRDASGPTIRRLDLPPPIITSGTPTGGSPSRDNASSRPTSVSLGLGVSVATRRDRTPISYLPSITQTTTSHSPATPTRKEGSAEDGKSPAASANGGTPTRHVRQSSGTSVQSDGSAAARKWAPAFWAPPSLNYHAGSLGSPTAAGSAAAAPGGSSWSPRGSIESIERRPSYTRRPSEESRYLSPHGSIGFSTAVAAAAAASGNGGGGGPSSSIGRGGSGGGGASGSPWELVKFSESRTFPLSPSHSRPGTPTSRPLGFFEDTTVPDSDELTVAARRSLSLRMSRNAFRQVEPLPESDDVSDSLNHSENEHSSRSERKFDGNEGRNGKRASRIRSEGKQAAVDVLTDPSRIKQGQPKNPALSRVAGSAQNKRRSLLWQFKDAKNGSTTMVSKPLGGQQMLARDEPQQSDTSSLYVPGLSDNALDSDSSELPGGRDLERTDRPSENAGHLNGGGSTKKHKRWWSVVLG